MNLPQKLICSGSAVAIGVLAASVPDGGATASGRSDDKRLIEQGRQLFMNETFDGNGRTCATCHPPTNNFTIDPEYIATLPDDDPLFVAEFNPDLAELEHPELLRRYGLILENVDGFDRPGVFRGVPHTLGLRVSTAVDPAGDDNLTREDGSTVVHAMGWSGDGAPGDGSLRSFAIGAIIQHFPKTLDRVEGEDFRLPTEQELDALEAFQLSLGRQTELDLATMFFADDDVEAGKNLFNGVGTNRACSNCHANAGANDEDGFNRNFGTNAAALMTDARRSDPEMPGDGGFGAGPEFEMPGIGAKFYGNGKMNTASLVEAADTPPFFHNNSAATIEDAVRFYTTETFSADNAFQLNDAQIEQVAAFLRAINALDNVSSVALLAKQAQRRGPRRARQTIKEVIANTEDAIEVLTGGPLDLYPDAVALLDQALAQAQAARDTEQTRARNATLRQVEDLMEQIPDLILLPAPDAEVAGEDGNAAESAADGGESADAAPADGQAGRGDPSSGSEAEPEVASAGG